MNKQNQAIVDNGDGTFSIVFDLSLYSENAIKAAAYKFAADCGALLKRQGDKAVEVVLTFDPSADDAFKSKLSRALCNEVLDQDLRERIFEQTEATRNLILAQAFSRTSLLE